VGIGCYVLHSMSLKFWEDFDNVINRSINVRDDKFRQYDDELKKLA
jgi:hypothetical protein